MPKSAKYFMTDTLWGQEIKAQRGNRGKIKKNNIKEKRKEGKAWKWNEGRTAREGIKEKKGI